MFIPDPGSRFLPIPDPGSRIPDPKTAMKDFGEKKFVVIPFFGVINFTKLNYFIFEMLKKKIWAKFQKIIELFNQILSLSSQKYGFGIRDSRSGIRKKPIPDPGSRGQKGTGSRIWIRNTVYNVPHLLASRVAGYPNLNLLSLPETKLNFT
jgi:hypothetical protein